MAHEKSASKEQDLRELSTDNSRPVVGKNFARVHGHAEFDLDDARLFNLNGEGIKVVISVVN